MMTRRHIAMLAAAYVGLGVAYGVGTWWLIVRTAPPYEVSW